jgi:diguanylate cyclase (GGDEF)-like protein
MTYFTALGVPLLRSLRHVGATAERTPRGIIASSVVVALAIYLLCAGVLLQERQDVWNGAQRDANNVAQLIERDVARNLELYDLSLRGVARGLAEPGFSRLPPTTQQLVLFDNAAEAPQLGAMLVLNEKGDIVFDSGHVPPRAANFGDHDYFTVHRNSPRVGLYVSHPYESLLNGTWSIALTRRLSHPDGSFAGVVLGSIRLDYFRDLFADTDFGPRGTMALMLDNGTMLMRRPYDWRSIGLQLRGTSNFERFRKARQGSFVGHAAIDGVERLYAFRQIGTFPLIVDVAPATDDIFTAWRHRAWVIGSLMGWLGVAIVVLATLLARQLARRMRAEAELVELVQTDSLTGLRNRRAFDAAFDAEWRRISRGTALSLLIIDIDLFKAYNDAYGHQAGDKALIAVALAINEASTGAGGFAARYGGEEFAVLLPGVSSKGAAQVGERIRASIADKQIAHRMSPFRHITVSVGSASAPEIACTSGGELIREADVALYEAKAAGRNFVHKATDRDVCERADTIAG